VAGVLPVPHVLHTPWSRAWAMTGYLMAALVIVVVNMVNLERSRDRALSEVTQRRETEAFLSEVVASPPGVFYAIDPDGRFLRWNRQMETLTGLSNAEITLAHFSQAIETSDKEAVIAAVAGAFERGSAEVEAKIQTMEGPRDFILTGRRVDAEAGAFVVGFGVDVTARHEAQQALVTLNKELDQRVELRTAQLEEALHSLESFSYSVSHDLRAPLRAINGYASILESDYPDALGEEGAQLCERIRANTLHMGGLIDDLMSFSRLERHQMHSEPVAMDRLVESVVADLSTGGVGEAVQWEVEPLPLASGDEAMLRQVWANLLGNAVKFSATVAAPLVTVACAAGSGEQVYSVSDNGVGFDSRYAAKVFDVFERLHGSDFDGTGIGLAIVKRIVEAHGGRVWCASQQGEGSTFSFSLPAGGSTEAVTA
jgi:PAS domain S-box-containing protein